MCKLSDPLSIRCRNGKCCAGTCARSASTSAATAPGPLPPAPRGAEHCLLAATERYGIYAYNKGTEDDAQDWRLDDVPRYDLLAQVSRALELYDSVLIDKH